MLRVPSTTSHRAYRGLESEIPISHPDFFNKLGPF
jgi:hypothetical protein